VVHLIAYRHEPHGADGTYHITVTSPLARAKPYAIRGRFNVSPGVIGAPRCRLPIPKCMFTAEYDSPQSYLLHA